MATFNRMARETSHAHRELALAELATRQHGVVALRQLEHIGFSPSGVQRRPRARRLHRIHQGVYAVGHPLLSVDGYWMAAVLACGPGAVLSYRSAAELLGLLASARAAIDVTVPNRAGRSRSGIDAHTATHLDPADTTTVRGIPCTSVARTLLDIAAAVPLRALERPCDQAEILRVFDLEALDDVMKRDPNHRGGPALRTVLTGHAVGETATRSEFEERFLALCLRAGLPRPEVNAYLVLDGGDAAQVDFLWRSQRVVVETDGYRTHGTRSAFERDRRRDQRLMLAGWRVVRVTWRQLVRERRELVEIVRSLLAEAARGDSRALSG